jgi:hypothetical protein
MRIVIAAVLIAASMQAGFAQAIQMASPESNKMVKTCLLQEGDVADATCHAFVLGVADTTAFYGAVQQMTPPYVAQRARVLTAMHLWPTVPTCRTTVCLKTRAIRWKMLTEAVLFMT